MSVGDEPLQQSLKVEGQVILTWDLLLAMGS